MIEMRALKPFQPVLVRNYDTQHWCAAFYSSNDSEASEFPYRITGGKTFKQCLPYTEETAHLLGTTDKPQHPDGSFKEEHFTNCRHSDWYGENMEEELKPFQKVLVRDFNHNVWHINFFERKCGEYFQCFSGNWKQCLPYTEETAHLLGTTDSPTPPEPEFKFGDKVEVCFNKGDAWVQAVFFNRIGELYTAITRGSDKAYMYQFCRHADW